jgi:predicted secreted hydrolase
MANQAIAQQPAYLSVTGPCNLEFPTDHGPHPGYRTEWWYYTGNLKSESGNRYGFQLTFFRNQITPSGAKKKWPRPSSSWRSQQVYIGHAAISDISNKQHVQAEVMAREALGMAGGVFRSGHTDVFINNWSARIGPVIHFLKADTDDFGFDLKLKPAKMPVLHGDGGYSQKGASPEQASCYYSISRLQTTGVLRLADKSERAAGLSWMDHEYGTAAMGPDLKGWDWFSLQQSDQTEIMIFLLRKKDGELSSMSSGTFVDASGQIRHLTRDDFELTVLDSWKSRHSKAVYPARWQLRIFPLSIDVVVTPTMADQEMRATQSTGVIYWEGSVSLTGKRNGELIEGWGYVEMTGYHRPFDAPI